MRAWSLCLAAMFLFPASIGNAQSMLRTPVRIGGNLEGVTDWAFSNVLADLVKQARGFGPPDAPWNGKVPLDAQGWPTVDFGVILGSWTGMRGIGGSYKISFRCRTLPKIGLVSSPGEVRNETRDPKTGWVTADLIYPATGPQLILSFTNTDGGVTNLKVIRPGCKATDTFTAAFLQHCARFACFRFMDFAATNGSPITRWSDRTSPSAVSYSAAAGAQVPWEVCIALCNRLKRDAWINVPHLADDNYVKSLANLFHRTLDPALHVYVEYSNEVWNWSFAQATWNKNQAAVDVKAGDPDLNFDHVNDPNVYSARRIAKRIKVISDLFRKEYGDAGWAKRVRPVLATQISWPAYWLIDGLTFLNDRLGPPSRYLYACAGAPYFNLGDSDAATNLTKADVLGALQANVDAQRTDLNMDACATLSRYYNLKFVGYEGGADTFGPNNIQAKKAAALDPVMLGICADYLNVWFSYGFDLINWFTAGASNYDSQYGTWGLTNDMTNQSAPKIRAVDQVIAQRTAPVMEGMLVPGSVDPRRFAFRDAKWQASGVLVLSPTDWRGPSRDYLLQVRTDGRHAVKLNAGTDQNGVKVEVWLNNAKYGVVEIPNTGGLATFRDAAPITIPIQPGINALRLKIVSGGRVALKQITIG